MDMMMTKRLICAAALLTLCLPALAQDEPNEDTNQPNVATTPAQAKKKPAKAQSIPGEPKVHPPRPAEQNNPPGTKDYALGPDSMEHPGVPQGKLTDELTLTSKIYDGMKIPYWVYTPAQYNPKVPAALMVINDGGSAKNRKNGTLNVIDNLIAQKKIPVMILLLASPGEVGPPGTPTYKIVSQYAAHLPDDMKGAMRSVEYNTMSDRFDRMMRDELLPEVEKHYNIRKDGYSHGITGNSAGAVAALNGAWQMPDLFSRVSTGIGAFGAVQWLEDPNVRPGGQDMAALILHNPRKNIRVWLQDGCNDQENPYYGSFPTANIAVANALKLKGNDFGLTFGEGNHKPSQHGSELPGVMIWLWRDYDPSKTSDDFPQDPAEQKRPPFRVALENREQTPLDRLPGTVAPPLPAKSGSR